jgi:hypothetical protein
VSKEDGVSLYKLSGNGVAPGMSGGPVLDPNSGKVIGLVKADRGQTDGAFVVSGTAIATAMPARWASHREAHRRDPRWRLQTMRARYAHVEPSTLEQYLQALTAAYRGSPMLPEGLDRARVRQPTRVRPRRNIGTQIAADRAIEDSDGEDGEADAGEAFLWDPLRSPWTSVAIVAGPGMGKTWLLSHHAVAIAERSFERVIESPEVHVDVRVPVVVSAAALARRLEPDPDLPQVTRALSATLRRALPLAPDADLMTPMLELALEDARVVLCVDGVDEVPDDLRERLRAALAMLESRVGQLVVSGRESARPTLERVFGGTEHEEFAITGFALGDVRRFVRSWHRDQPELIEKVERALRDSPGLRTLTHVPLLLSFICRLAAEGHALATTRSGLYREVALNVLAGRWRAPEPGATDPVVRLRLLANTIGPLAASWRSRPDEFSEHDVEMALRQQPGYDVVHDAALSRWRIAAGLLDRTGEVAPSAPVLWEFLHDGLLNRTQGPLGEQLLRFSHLVFGELCVAMWLAQLEFEQQAEQIENHRWFDSHWADIIPIACGVADDPRVPLACLDVDLDDPWLMQAQLLAGCMVEAPTAASEEVVNGLVSTLVRRLATGPASDVPAARRVLALVLTGRVAHADERLVAALQNRELPALHKGFVMRLLCQVGESYAVAKCKQIVSDSRAHPGEREEAARALCRSGDSSAVDIVITSFATQRGTYRHLAVALANGEAPLQAAVELVRRRDVDQALRVAVAVEQLRSNGVETAARELLADPALGLGGHVALTVALLRAGQPVDSAKARELMANPNITLGDRLELVHALLLRGEFTALPTAADLVISLDIDHRRRRALAQTMFSIGREGAGSLFLSATKRDAPPAARLQALLALIERRHGQACHVAAALAADGEGERWVQAQLLGGLLFYARHTVDEEAVAAMLADRELSDGKLHVAWEDLAQMAMRAGGPELRTRLAQRITARIGTGEEQPTELAAVDVRRLLMLLAASGPHGLELLLDIAHDQKATIDTRIDAAMAAVLGDVALVERLVDVLADDDLPLAIRDRLAVAFAMLGAPEMHDRVIDMLPSSEPAYVALRAILQGDAATADTVGDGVRRGREAVRALRDAPPVTWDLEFIDLARELRFEPRSQTERELQEEWLAERIRTNTYARLLALLLPSERAALDRIGGFVDSPETRDWLAMWIPAYKEVASTEVAHLQECIDTGTEVLPRVDPDWLARLSEFEALARTSRLLGEWWRTVEDRHWSACVALMSAHRDLFATPFARDVNDLATKLDPNWPVANARAFLLHAVGVDDGLAGAHRLVTTYNAANDAAKAELDGANAPAALGAASLGVVRNPHDASSYFYAAEALLMAGQLEAAQKLIGESATHATPLQAAEGRKSLLEFGRRHDVPPEAIADLRRILRGAMQDSGTSEDALDDEPGLEPTETTTDDADSPEVD